MSIKLENRLVNVSELYLQSEFADVNFVFSSDGQSVKVPANKIILAIASTVFKAMLFGPIKEKDVIEIVDVDASAFEEFLQFFYLPKITLTTRNMEAVVRLADKYDIMDRVRLCALHLEKELTEENIILGYQLAILLNNQGAIDYCERNISYFTCEHLKTHTFLHCDRNILERILQLDMLSCTEFELFEACIAWAKVSCLENGLNENDPIHLKEQLGDCFHLIRFKEVKGDEIASILSNEQYKALFTKEELADILGMRSIENFQSTTFTNTGRSPVKWDSNNVLNCERDAGERDAGCIIQPRESTWFSVSVPVILGEVGVTGIQYFNNFKFVKKVSVTIVEYKDVKMPAANKVIYTGNVEAAVGDVGSVTLTKPIIIKPSRTYEVRLEFQDFFGNSCYHKRNWKQECHLQGVVVKFHRNPWMNNTHSGLVSNLKFNAILEK